MPYISPNNEYPRYPGDIQIENPEWNVGDTLPTGWIFVNETNPPELEPGQTYEAGDPEEINGEWFHTWIVRNLTESELSILNAPRTAREKLVALGFSEAEIQAIAQNRLA
jgi:hypothetical protein